MKFVVTKITREQQATLKFISNENVDPTEIIKQLNNQSFEVYVCSEGVPLYVVAYEIKPTRITDSGITISLHYPNPSNLSTSQMSETLKIVNLYNLYAIQQSRYLTLPDNCSSEGLIPAQLASKSEQQISALFEGSRISFTGNFAGNILIGYIIQFVWMQLEDVTFLTINSFISVSISGYP